jgi:hypothetical protein
MARFHFGLLRALLTVPQDIIQKWPSKKNADLLTLKNKKQVWSFNGVTSIKAKVSSAIDQGAGVFLTDFFSRFVFFNHQQRAGTQTIDRWSHDLGGWSRLQVTTPPAPPLTSVVLTQPSTIHSTGVYQ